MRLRLLLLIPLLLLSLIAKSSNESYSNVLVDSTKWKMLSFFRPKLGYFKQDLYQFGVNVKRLNDEVGHHNYMLGLAYNTDNSLSYRLGYGRMWKISESARLKSKFFVKSNPYFRSSDFDYSLNYRKLRADLEYLPNQESNKKLFTSIAWINEQQASFSNNVVTKNTAPLFDIKLGLVNFKSSEVGQLNHSIIIEYGQYKDPFKKSMNFSKLSYSGLASTKIDKKRKLYLGLFAAFMLQNDQRATQSFANELVKGTISLSGQSMADYLYDYDYFSRKGSVNFLDNQFAQQGGRMRFFNTRGSRVGLSNDLGFVLTSSLEIVKNSFMTLSPFLDYGGYSDFSNGKRTLRNIYSGGLELRIKELIVVDIPFFQSSDVKNANDFSQKSLINRIGFSFDLRKMYFNSNYSSVTN